MRIGASQLQAHPSRLAWLQGRRSDAKMGERTAGPAVTSEKLNQSTNMDRQTGCVDPSSQLADQSTQVAAPRSPSPTRMTRHMPGVVSSTVPCCHRLIQHPLWIK